MGSVAGGGLDEAGEAGVAVELAILGAQGQVGRALTALVREKNIAHRVFGRAECDITDADAVKRAVREARS